MISIITPTYNREKNLKNLYNSLLRQTIYEFEWIIVDDGSTDNTEKLLSDFKHNSNFFKIYYYKKKNGGKHTAVNYALKYVNYDYVFILDSDDLIVDDAVECICKWINDSRLGNEKCIGVSGLRGKNVKGKLERIGQYPIDKNCIVATNLERKQKRLLGDKAEVYKTIALKQYPFPEFENEKFIPEDVVWNKLALDGCYLLWYDKIITITDYLPDGLTMSNSIKRFRDNYRGYCLSYYYNWIGLSFPYNFSSAAEFVNKSKLINKDKEIIKKVLKINEFEYLLILIVIKFKVLIRKLGGKNEN